MGNKRNRRSKRGAKGDADDDDDSSPPDGADHDEQRPAAHDDEEEEEGEDPPLAVDKTSNDNADADDDDADDAAAMDVREDAAAQVHAMARVAFGVRVYQLVESVDDAQQQKKKSAAAAAVFRWDEDGASFVVQKSDPELLALYLDKFFYFKGLESFQAYATAYGFDISETEDGGYRFRHPLLHRDRPIDAGRIIVVSSSDRDKPKQMSIPQKLHIMVTEVSHTHPRVMRWSDDGAALYIDRDHKDLPDLLGKYQFSHRNIVSLHRAMNHYGFSIKPHGTHANMFVRDGFHRDKTSDFSTLKKRPTRQDRERREQREKKKASRSDSKPAAAKRGVASSDASDDDNSLSTDHDYDLSTLDTDDASSTGSRKHFPTLLHNMVSKVARESNAFRWSEDGECLFIDHDDPELPAILKRYGFSHGNIKSLKRQMCVYGFIAPRSGEYKGGFIRKNFNRDRLGYCGMIKKKPRHGDRARHEKRLEAEGDTANAYDTEHDYDLSTLASTETFGQDSLVPDKADDDASLTDPIPEPKYRVYQRVFARDTDGVMYEAVIRRMLYGPNNQRQVQMGLVASTKEAEQLLSQDDIPTWHYFVHYNKWNVNYDRFVSEHDIYEPTEKVKAYAARLLTEHRALQKELAKTGVKNKKLWQTIDGIEFHRHWRKRIAKVDEEMQFSTSSERARDEDGAGGETKSPADSADGKAQDAGEAKKSPRKVKPNKSSVWTKAALAMECKLRDNGLSRKRKPAEASKILLPFQLKKVLVDQWELISQCDMVPTLPSPVPIRSALDKYVESKGVVLPPKKDETVENAKNDDTAMVGVETTNPSKEATADVAAKKDDTAMDVDAPARAKAEVASATKDESAKAVDTTPAGDPANVNNEATKNEAEAMDTEKPSTTPSRDRKAPDRDEGIPLAVSFPTPKKHAMDSSNAPESTAAAETEEDSETRKRWLEWIEMADGIALFFDEALSFRLLYREEAPQSRVLDSHPIYSMKRPSEIYGCEHLLRLFVRLPEILAEEMDDAESRSIIAKINDLVRFLHKNQSELFVQTCRKLNELELKERKKLLKQEERRKRKRAAAAEVATTSPKKRVRPATDGTTPEGSGEKSVTTGSAVDTSGGGGAKVPVEKENKE